MAIFHSYVKLPEGKPPVINNQPGVLVLKCLGLVNVAGQGVNHLQHTVAFLALSSDKPENSKFTKFVDLYLYIHAPTYLYTSCVIYHIAYVFISLYHILYMNMIYHISSIYVAYCTNIIHYVYHIKLYYILLYTI